MDVPRAYIEFDFDERLRAFVLDPFGEKAEALCRRIPKIEFNSNVKKFYLSEMFWGELESWCRKVGFVPDLVRQYATRKHPEYAPAQAVSPTGIELRDYQRVGVGVLKVPGGRLLADDMGLGKTAQALIAYGMLRHEQPENVRGMVVLCPPNVLAQWGEEAKKFLGVDCYTLEAPGDVAFIPSEGIIVMAYPKVFRDPYQSALLELMRSRKWVLCMDEIHRSGAEGTQQHEALKAMVVGPVWKWGLTGTEVRDGPDSFVPVYRLLTGGTITTESFMSYFCRASGEWSEKRLSRVRQVRNQFGIRRCKAEVLTELPPITEMVHHIELTPEQAQMRDTLREGGYLKRLGKDGMEELIENKGILGEMIRDFQICSHPLCLGGSTKATLKWPLVREIITNRGDQQVILWSYHPDTIEWLADQLRKISIPCETVHGGVSQKQRDDHRTRFIAGEYPVLVANPLSYAEGVNLQNASIIIYWDEHFSKDKWQQSRARVYRLGQTLPVTVHHIVHPGTVEAKCFDYVRVKKQLSDAMIGEAQRV